MQLLSVRDYSLPQAFTWVNSSVGNVKNSIRGTFHAIRPKHVARYLAQFQYRFNRRYQLEAMIPRLAWVDLRTPPMPYNLSNSLRQVGNQEPFWRKEVDCRW